MCQEYRKKLLYAIIKKEDSLTFAFLINYHSLSAVRRGLD